MKMWLVINNTDGDLVYKNKNQMYIWSGKDCYRTMTSEELVILVATNPQFIKNDWIVIKEVEK